MLINIADLKDPNDSNGRTYREVNNAKQHKFAINDLVELENGTRLFIAKQTRDCDGTPLYSLTHEIGVDARINGFPEECFTSVANSEFKLPQLQNKEA